ncbi:conjugative transposon protein TraM [uncultured Mucilaginibacter sp.]|uniref:conjugative transposon protein TraM n=1 Tax=uncultured Mucilaginibacter sp. TaxID=797541 RepID=UPI0025DA745D|nr:conjugative transposon protein TraM [uncultured Mucilaginibacter sp.]
MKINFKQPKYVLPLIALPFLCLFFYVYHSGSAKNKKETKQLTGINGSVGEVSPEVKKKDLDDKLDAYRDRYKEADGNTAVNPIPSDGAANNAINNPYSNQQKRQLDSIDSVMKRRFSSRPLINQRHSWSAGNVSGRDRQLADALNNLSSRQKEKQAGQNSAVQASEKDPMATFREQMTYLDSVNKANDPAVKAEKAKKEALAKREALRAAEPDLPVRKLNQVSGDFNTVIPEKEIDPIKVVIDENLTGYASSRIRLRLLDDMNVGRYLIKKDTYLYALITGFSGQRVTLAVRSIIYQDKILPVKLEIYDLDGLQGLYVPESAFRDFTKDLGTNTVQGVTLNSDGTGTAASQLMMSSVDKIFQSTSSAIAGVIRKNKAKIKYNSYLYLIDNDAAQAANGGALLSTTEKK